MNKTVSVRSPLTGGVTTQVDAFDVGVINEAYKDSGLDVSEYFSGLREVAIRKCHDTGYRFAYPPSVAGEAGFYDDLYRPEEGKEQRDYRRWSADYQFAFDRIIPGERLLDIGCGFGYFLGRAAEKADAQGVDGNPHAVEKCLARGLNVHFGSIQSFAVDHAESFDTVCFFQVLEHIYETGSFLSSALSVLKPGGRMILAVPNNEPFYRRYDKYSTWNLPPHHVGYWNKASLEAMGDHFGLTLVEHEYSDTSNRILVDAYLRAAYWMDVRSKLHEHSLTEKIKILAAMPFSMPLSVTTSVLRKGTLTRDVIAVVLKKRM